MTMTTQKAKGKVYGTVTFDDPISATIFYRGASEYKTGLRDKDLIRFGNIVANLYRASAGGNAQGKAALQELVEIIVKNTERFNEITFEIQEAFNDLSPEQQLPIHAGVGLSFPISWNNKMFLSTLQILQKFDSTRKNLYCLLEHKAVSKKEYFKMSKRLISPIRSIIEASYPISKKMSQSKDR